jgi:hypothetical protein
MEKRPKADSSWLEADFASLLSSRPQLDEAVCVAITGIRIEMTGADLDKFRAKFAAAVDASAVETSGMTDEQKSYYVARKMLIG